MSEVDLQQRAAGHTVYVLNTWWPDSGCDVEEDSPFDLVKIGETVRPIERLSNHVSRSPLPLRLTWTLTPFRDHWCHWWLEQHGHSARWEQARELGLPTPSEWFRGGAEHSLIWLLRDPGLSWVEVRARDDDGTWVDVREHLARIRGAA